MSLVLKQLQEWARTKATSIALHDGVKALTYAELLAAVMRVRTQIEAGNYSVVAVAGDNSIAWIVADLALLGLPVRVVPVPGFFSASQVQHIFQQAQVEVILASSVDIQRVPGINPVQLCYLDQQCGMVACRLPVQNRYSGDYEKITFTSGSTGSPKGVRLSLATVENTAKGIAETLANLVIESHLSVLPYATLLENCAGIYAPLLEGITIHVRKMAELGLQSPEQFNPMLLALNIQQIQPHATILVPQLLLALVTMAQRGILNQHKFNFIAVGGGKVSTQLLALADQCHLPVYEGYGLSECCSVVTLNTPQNRRSGTVGKVLPHAQLHIAADGEIHVSGSIMKGYLGEEELSSAASIATGDIGSMDADGYVAVSGRKKNLFITAFGRNVNPEWVEAELLCQLPIAQVAVYGEAMPANTAIVVARQGFSQLAVENAISQCNQTLPDYARIGRVILAPEPFSQLNGMATPNGRIRRFAIAQYYADIIASEANHEFLSTIAAAN